MAKKQRLTNAQIYAAVANAASDEDENDDNVLDELISKLPLPNVYYDIGSQAFFVPKQDQGGWVKASRNAVVSYLISLGYNSRTKKSQLQSELDHTLLRIMREHYVDYAGSLAGFHTGWYLLDGNRVLVTTSPSFVAAKPGQFPLLTEVLHNLIGSDQLPYLYGWLKMGLQMYRTSKWQPGQALAVCGPPEAGKSLLADLIKILFGGRAGHPYTHMIGRTQFNSDLISNELLVIDDAAEATDYRGRRHLGASIKSITVLQSQRCERKFADPIMLPPRRRLMILLNDDPERMQVLPPLDDDIADKIILLRATKSKMPMPTTTPDQYYAFWSALVAELPMFVNFLENWTIEPALQSSRFGICEYHDYALTKALEEFSPEMHLLAMIDEQVFDGNEPSWTGSSRELELLLKDQGRQSSMEARRLLQSSNSCGIYLARLEKNLPQRVSSRIVNGQKRWTIEHKAQADMPLDDPDFTKSLERERRKKKYGYTTYRSRRVIGSRWLG